MRHEDANFCCNRTDKKDFRRELRSNGTVAEATLWMSLKQYGKKLGYEERNSRNELIPS